MTGCGYARVQTEDSIITVEIKSVNSRYLDVNVKMPRMYSRVEEKVKQTLGKYTTRGKCDIYISTEALPGSDNVSLSIDEVFLVNYLKCLYELRDKHGLRDDISVMSVARNSDVFTSVRQEDKTPEQLWEKLSATVEQSFKGFFEMKKNEGKRLGEDILLKLDNIESFVSEIEKVAPAVVEQYAKNLEERVSEMCKSPDYDKTRVIEEVAIFADRVAIDEELVRLHSHLAQFRDLIENTGDVPCGRKLDFLLQEINREINTTGSKCNSAEIARVVVDAKSELEKIREQVQNIE